MWVWQRKEEMKPFKKNVAVAIDGGGIRGIVVAQALASLEEHLGKTAHDIFRLAAGTSTGSIISAGIAAGLSAQTMTQLYLELGRSIFHKTLRSMLFPFTRYRYSNRSIIRGLYASFGDMKMGDLWKSNTRTDLVITTYDLQENRTLFVKPWKEEYKDWLLLKAVLASCTVPTYFPVFEDRYIDGGVGSYGNPCYIAAYEAKECLNWDPAETTLISIGTGRAPYYYDTEKGSKLWAWDWIGGALNVFTQSAYDQQVHLVETYFKDLDFRRFQVNLREPIAMDDVGKMEELQAYGVRLGRMILNDQYDSSQGIVIKHPGYF